MATTKDCLIYLVDTLIKGWFANPDAAFNVPISPNNILAYSTTPAESSDSPNWIIGRVLHTTADSEVFDNTDLPGRLAITLFSAMSETEASRRAAEHWLTDAEEWLVKKLDEVGPTDYWYEIVIVGNPRRDQHRRYHGSHRTSDIVIEIDKMS